MGTCYYLIREDDTVYDLGKAYGWGECFGYDGFGTQGLMVLMPQDADALAILLRDRLLSTGYWNQKDIDEAPNYLFLVCADIARWSEGKSFVFAPEYDRRLEDIQDRGREQWQAEREAWVRYKKNGHTTPEPEEDLCEPWITGGRFSTDHPEWYIPWAPGQDMLQHALPMSIVCASCGTRRDPDLAACPSCGST